MSEAPQKKRRLVDIVEDFRQLLLTIHDEGGVVEGELLDELEDCEEAFEAKVENCLLMSEEFSAQAEMYDRRAKALKEHSRSMAKRSTRLKEMVRAGMISLEIQKLRTPSFPAVYLRKTRKLEITNPDKVADHCAENEDVVRWKYDILKTGLSKLIKEDLKTQKELADSVRTVESVSLVVK